MRYSEIISLNERFQPAYDLENEMEDYWKTFIPTRKFYEILKETLDVLESNLVENRQSIWIQGTYGTGKSHAAAVIKHLLSDDPEVLDDFDIKDSQLAARLRSFREKKRIFPVVIKGTSGITDPGEFTLLVEKSVKRALRDEGHDLSVKTDFENLIEQLNKGIINFEGIFQGTELELFGKEQILSLLEKEDIEIQRKVEKVLSSNRISIGKKNITEWLKEVNEELKERGIADNLMIFWDEFTGIMDLENSGPLLTEVQNIAELSAKHGIYLFIISHRTPHHLKHKGKEEDVEKILGRFKLLEYSMESITTYHLIENTIKKKDEKRYNSLKNESISKIVDVINRITAIEDDARASLENIFPIHPYTAYIATIIARQIGSTERSIFKFLYNDKNGFKAFLSSDVTERPFLTADNLWDFFFEDFERIESEKVYSIIERYKLYNEEMEALEERYSVVFKVVLLLNLIYRLVELGEASILKPEIENICHIFEGYLEESRVKEVLDYMDNRKIMNKNPDGMFLISSSTLPSEEIEREKETLRDTFNKVSVVLSEDNKNELLNSINALREVETHIFDLPPNEFSLKSRLETAFKEDYAVQVALFLGLNETEINKIESYLIKASNEDHLKNKLLIVSKKELGEDEFDRFLEYKARSNIAARHNYMEDKEENEKYAKKIIDKWINEIQNDYLTYFFYGKDDSELFSRLGNSIDEKFSRKIFPYGLETVEAKQNKNIWKNERSPKTAEIFLFAENREELEEKTRSGVNKYLRIILKDNNGNYIVDNNFNFKDDASREHPIIVMDGEIKKAIENEGDGVFNLGDTLKFLSKHPYGLYKSKINIAALSFLMRKYVDQLFEAGSGIQVTKERMRDKVIDIFNYWENGRNKEKLNVRCGSENEKKLIRLFSDIFDLSDVNSLNDVKWKIKEWVKEQNIPLWLFRYKDSSQEEKIERIFNLIFDFTKSNDTEIDSNMMGEIINEIEDFELDIKNHIKIATSQKEGLWIDAVRDWLKEHLTEENGDISYSDIMKYLKHHLQEDMGSWNENDVKDKVKDWYIKSISKPSDSVVDPVSGNDPVVDPVTVIDPVSGTGTEAIDRVKERINQLAPEELREVLKKLIDKDPSVVGILEQLIGGH
ncbi:conserved hypothetical protein [Methanothermobacter sp. CaT2]|uniref:hypothetical protein n=1 Tax=Methanothermobacter sp. CaT2 TaxID=866790 RepID=UPI0002CD0718|nr:hypothetical protein [Methanothermobacter sp. CaT2]BAM69677.1 conserved hypothetical protein [Methanothermobacter sp. CaT2]